MGRYLKEALAVSLWLAGLADVAAQLSVGVGGITVKEGAQLHISGLEFRPTVDLKISSLELGVSATPASGDNGSGLARVYQFSSPLPFRGLLPLYYQLGELNGHAESDLVLAYKPAVSQPYVLAQSSTVNTSERTVEHTFGGISLYQLTATGRLVTLPLQLINFSAVADGARSRIFWTAQGETGVQAYRVLRSLDGRNFDLLEEVSGKESSGGSNDYMVYDRLPAKGQNYYKLQELDVQGNLHELGIRAVNMGLDKSGFLLFPNPGSGPFFLDVGDLVAGKLKVSLLDAQGRIVSQEQVAVNKAQQRYPILRRMVLAKGMYVLRVQGADGDTSLKLIVP